MAESIIATLRRDHDEVREMFRQLENSTGEAREDLFHELLGELVRHEVAEEMILRPVSRRDAGDAMADARIKEESQAEELLKEMEKLDPSGEKFAEMLTKLHMEVEQHATTEETQEFPKVEQAESMDRLEKMGQAYEAAKAMAPTRPHPGTPNTATANMLVGPFAAVMDRAKDAIRDATKSSGS